MNDPFFSQTTCDRCGNQLTARIMSWFTNDTICMDCSKVEKAIRNNLPNKGIDLEGCGYIPTA